MNIQSYKYGFQYNVSMYLSRRIMFITIHYYYSTNKYYNIDIILYI